MSEKQAPNDLFDAPNRFVKKYCVQQSILRSANGKYYAVKLPNKVPGVYVPSRYRPSLAAPVELPPT